MIPLSTTHTTITSAAITTSSSKMNSLNSSLSSLPQHSSSALKSKRQQAALTDIANSKKTHEMAKANRDQHQPYSTSLVNSGFGFGFDLQGGDADNQLTFIVNVHPNGDASRKGLTDG